jgi:hypothetical protein
MNYLKFSEARQPFGINVLVLPVSSIIMIFTGLEVGTEMRVSAYRMVETLDD